MKNIIFCILVLVIGIQAKGQSLTVINNTVLDLTYKLKASLEECDRYCYFNNKISANSTIVHPRVDSIRWACDRKPGRFSSFSLSGKKEIGHCGALKPEHTIEALNMHIQYKWTTVGNNIIINIEPVQPGMQKK